MLILVIKLDMLPQSNPGILTKKLCAENNNENNESESFLMLKKIYIQLSHWQVMLCFPTPPSTLHSSFLPLRKRNVCQHIFRYIFFTNHCVCWLSKTLTLHLAVSQAVNHPVKVSGSNPCFIRTMGVSGSLLPGCVRRYSWLVTTVSLRSTSFASLPIQRNTWNHQWQQAG